MKLPELETRVCVCGCGTKFKVIPTSTLRYAKRFCQGLDVGEGHWLEQKKNRNDSPRIPRKWGIKKGY